MGLTQDHTGRGSSAARCTQLVGKQCEADAERCAEQRRAERGVRRARGRATRGKRVDASGELEGCKEARWLAGPVNGLDLNCGLLITGSENAPRNEMRERPDLAELHSKHL